MEDNGNGGNGYEPEIAPDEVDGSGSTFREACDDAWHRGKDKFGGEAKRYRVRDTYVSGNNPITEYKVILKRSQAG